MNDQAKIDVGATTAPKSDQLNADDLLTGPRTIRITGIKKHSAEQPIAIRFEGDDGKPFLPCKSMRRVLVAVWGDDGRAYVGRSMTLFCDRDVAYGGIKVGGIRISHMSHMEADTTIALTKTRGKREPYVVRRLKEEAPKKEPAKQEDKPAGNLAQALAMIETWTGEVADIKTKLAEFSWTSEERAELKEAIGRRK